MARDKAPSWTPAGLTGSWHEACLGALSHRQNKIHTSNYDTRLCGWGRQSTATPRRQKSHLERWQWLSGVGQGGSDALPSLGPSLRPLDLEFMKHLSKVVNIVPVIAKADTMTLEEKSEFKQRVRRPPPPFPVHTLPSPPLVHALASPSLLYAPAPHPTHPRLTHRRGWTGDVWGPTVKRSQCSPRLLSSHLQTYLQRPLNT